MSEKGVASGVLSRAAAARYFAPYVGVLDVEADQAQVAKDQAEEDRRTVATTRASVRADLDDPSWSALFAKDRAPGDDEGSK